MGFGECHSFKRWDVSNISGTLDLRNPQTFKLYGYGLCKGKPTPKIAENKVQYLLVEEMNDIVEEMNDNAKS